MKKIAVGFILGLFTSFSFSQSLADSLKLNEQIPGSDFSKWHTEEITGFAAMGTTRCDEMIGEDENSLWDTGNAAFSASGSKLYPTQKTVLPDGSIAAKLTTRKTFGVMASGSLFTGRVIRKASLKFLMEASKGDGNKLISWGIPFSSRPKGIRVKIKYNPVGDDNCSISATLENRDAERRYIATALFISHSDDKNITNCPTVISEPDENGLRTVEVDFLYGEYPDNGGRPLPQDIALGGASEKVTHVNVCFASSADGDRFIGSKDSSLIVKDFEFVY